MRKKFQMQGHDQGRNRTADTRRKSVRLQFMDFMENHLAAIG